MKNAPAETIEKLGLKKSDKSDEWELGKIVAVQYPAKFEMSIVEGDGAKALDEYSLLETVENDGVKTLKPLDNDSKEGRVQLAAGIKDMKKRISENKKEEETAKKPVNKFRTLILDTAKILRSEIEPVLLMLVNEKQRLDDIDAAALEAQKRLWNDNLTMIRAKGQNIFGFNMDQLSNELAIIECCNLDDFDFGELLEDAKEAKANARVRVEQAIAMEEQRLKVIAQQEELNRQAAEQAAEKFENDWDAALVTDELFDLKRKKFKEQLNETLHTVAADLQVPVSMLTAENVSEESAKEYLNVIGKFAPAGFDDEEPAQDAPAICANDQLNLELFIVRLSDTASKAGRYESTVCTDAIARCLVQLGKMQEFLTKVKEQ